MVYYDYIVFFFNDTATTEIYTLSLHDALPISVDREVTSFGRPTRRYASSANTALRPTGTTRSLDRKSTRLNSSHVRISYAVFFLKKKHQISCNSLFIIIRTNNF